MNNMLFTVCDKATSQIRAFIVLYTQKGNIQSPNVVIGYEHFRSINLNKTLFDFIRTLILFSFEKPKFAAFHLMHTP